MTAAHGGQTWTVHPHPGGLHSNDRHDFASDEGSPLAHIHCFEVVAGGPSSLRNEPNSAYRLAIFLPQRRSTLEDSARPKMITEWLKQLRRSHGNTNSNISSHVYRGPALGRVCHPTEKMEASLPQSHRAGPVTDVISSTREARGSEGPSGGRTRDVNSCGYRAHAFPPHSSRSFEQQHMASTPPSTPVSQW